MNKFDIFLKWLQDIGGSYDTLRTEPEVNPKRANYEPKHKTVYKPLNPRLYYADGRGNIRKISQQGLHISEKLGI